MDDFIDDISYTPQSLAVPYEVENVLSSSTNRSKKREKYRESNWPYVFIYWDNS